MQTLFSHSFAGNFFSFKYCFSISKEHTSLLFLISDFIELLTYFLFRGCCRACKGVQGKWGANYWRQHQPAQVFLQTGVPPTGRVYWPYFQYLWMCCRFPGSSWGFYSTVRGPHKVKPYIFTFYSLTRRRRPLFLGLRRITGNTLMTVWPRSKEQMMGSALSSASQRFDHFLF